jgi:hypothetical protein
VLYIASSHALSAVLHSVHSPPLSTDAQPRQMACHYLGHKSFFSRWIPKFITMGSARLSWGDTAAIATDRVLEKMEPKQQKSVALIGLSLSTAESLTGRGNVMVLTPPGGAELFFSFENASARDLCVTRLQVRSCTCLAVLPFACFFEIVAF